MNYLTITLLILAFALFILVKSLSKNKGYVTENNRKANSHRPGYVRPTVEELNSSIPSGLNPLKFTADLKERFRIKRLQKFDSVNG